MSEKTENATIQVRLVSEIPNYYRSYYEVVEPAGGDSADAGKPTGAFYALTNFRSVRTWNTTTGDGGELGEPLKDGLKIEITDAGQVISREIISRVDENASIGLPVIEPPEEPAKPRRGKKAADGDGSAG